MHGEPGRASDPGRITGFARHHARAAAPTGGPGRLAVEESRMDAKDLLELPLKQWELLLTVWPSSSP
jgi:hypothetical protein